MPPPTTDAVAVMLPLPLNGVAPQVVLSVMVGKTGLSTTVTFAVVLHEPCVTVTV